MIRTARLSDIYRILELCYNYYLEGNVPKLKFSKEKMLQFLYNGVLEEDKNVTVLEESEKIIGFTLSDITGTIFSEDLVIECNVLYVHPDYRKGTNGVKLIKALTRLAKEHKAQYVYLGITSEIQTKRTETLYQKLGYLPIGKDFRLEV